MSSPLRLLRCPVQTYHWGKTGERSLVGRLAKRGGHLASIDDSTPYAELWMGTHPSKPSLLQDSGRQLREEIGDCGGSGGGGAELSFLFKVLSVETALSIQAHPDKARARQLRTDDPAHYPDSNHKPELAIALTDFEALCCFRPLEEIDAFIAGVPELRAVVAGVDRVQTKADLRAAYSALMTSPREVFEPQLDALIKRLAAGGPAAESLGGVVTPTLRDVLLRLAQQYPADIGLFSVFFLNLVTLRPGEALFLAANEPHAYLSGDCVECMATSDNVVRAGLTPKFKDVHTLVKMLTYEPTREPRFQPEAVSERGVSRFRPPVDDFAVVCCRAGKGDAHGPTKLDRSDSSGSIAIVVEGTGTLLCEGARDELDVHEGSVVYIPPKAEVAVRGDGLLLFQAYTPAPGGSA